MPHVSRRAVLQSAPFLVAALVRCTNALDGRARVAEAFVIDPSWAAYQPTLRGVITAILPFEAAGFPPITAVGVEQRLIVLFDEIDLFTRMSGPLAQEESKARDLLARGGDVARVLAEIEAADEAAFAVFAREHGVNRQSLPRFRDLSLDARRAYIDLWRESASIVKRQFSGALRSLVMVTTYSMEATWLSIGYAGPLVPRTVSET